MLVEFVAYTGAVIHTVELPDGFPLPRIGERVVVDKFDNNIGGVIREHPGTKYGYALRVDDLEYDWQKLPLQHVTLHVVQLF